MTNYFLEGESVWDRDGKVEGKLNGGGYLCRLEGCGGMRVTVKWPDGKLTFPCTKGMVPYKKGWKIG